jgi:hypothetical protein
VGEFPKTFPYKGTNLIKDELRDKIKKLKSGSSVTFQNIRAKGPDGVKKCNPVVLEIQ